MKNYNASFPIDLEYHLNYNFAMTTKATIAGIKTYRKASIKKRKAYLQNFTEKMLYRTTKTENPQTTKKMVKKVLKRT